MNTRTFLVLGLLVFCKFSWAQSPVSLTPVDINDRLEEALDRSAEESRKEQKLTGGQMIVAGSALAVAGLFGTFVGNDFSTQTAPAVYITAGGLLAAGGVFNLSRDNDLTQEIKTYHDHPKTTLEDIQAQIAIGQDILQNEARRERRNRLWGAWLTIAAGSANILIGETSTTPSRGAFEVVGYTSGVIGYTDMILEKQRWNGGALMTLGLSNVIDDRINPYSPSSDYLLISGSLVCAAGIARLFLPYPVEKERDTFFNAIKSADYFVTPTPDGFLASTKIQF